MADDASSPMMSVTDDDNGQRTNIIDIFEVHYAKGPKGQKAPRPPPIPIMKKKQSILFL